MSDRILVATRKGLFTFERGSAWTLTGTAFLGDPVSMVLRDGRDGVQQGDAGPFACAQSLPGGVELRATPPDQL